MAAPLGQTLPLPGEPPTVQPDVGGQSPLMGEGTLTDFGVVERFKWRFGEIEGKLWVDADNYLSWTTARDMVIALGLTAVLANTPMDQHFQNWFQNDVRSSGTDHFSNSIAFLGHGQDMIPAAIGLTVAGTLIGDNWLGNTTGDFGSQTCRAYLIGRPPCCCFSTAWGRRALATATWSTAPIGGRLPTAMAPAATPSSARCRFITAANMTDNYFLKAAFFLGSTMVAFGTR